MSKVSSPTRTPTRLGRLGISLCAAVLIGGLLAPPAQASVSSLKQQAARAAAAAKAAKAKADAAARRVSTAQGAVAASGQQVTAAAAQVDDSQQAAAAAGAVLTASEKKLADAQRTLFLAREKLQDARDFDAVLAAELARAEAALADAQRAVKAGQADVDAQRAIIAGAAREQFQQQGTLEGLTVVLGASSPSDLTQRVQWTDTIFDTQAADRDRLTVAQAQLQSARELQAQISDRVAAAKRQAAAQVAVVASLEAEAKRQEGAVASLVRRNRAQSEAAQSQVADDQETLDTAKQTAGSAKKRLADARKQAAKARAEIRAAQAEERALQKAIKRALANPGSGSSGGSSGDIPRGTVSAAGFIRPVDASPGSPFGMRFHPILRIWRLHAGTDFGAACGTPIYAAKAGTVILAYRAVNAGNYTVISHGGGVTTGYLHQSRFAVSVGERVSRGQLIGYVGTTGLSTGCHLHLEVRQGGSPVNPMRYVP